MLHVISPVSLTSLLFMCTITPFSCFVVTGVSGFVRNPLLAPLSYLRLAVDGCHSWQHWLAQRECLSERQGQHQKNAPIFFFPTVFFHSFIKPALVYVKGFYSFIHHDLVKCYLTNGLTEVTLVTFTAHGSK